MKAKAKQYQSPKILRGLSNVLEFGKHKGETLKEVMNTDVNWTYWAMDNIDDFRLNPTALKALPPFIERSYEREFRDAFDKY